MSSKKKLIITLSIVSIALLLVIAGLVVVLVAGDMTARSNVKVEFTANRIRCEIEGAYIIGGDSTPITSADGVSNKLVFEPEVTSAAFANTSITMQAENPRVIFMYKCKNTDDDVDIKLALNEPYPTETNVNVKYVFTNSPVSNYETMGNAEQLDFFEAQLIEPGITRYIYVIVDIVRLMDRANYSGTLSFDLSRAEIIEANISYASGLTVTNANDIAVKGLAGARFQEPQNYPMGIGYHFDDYYYDSTFTNKVEWPAIINEGQTIYARHIAGSALNYEYTSNAYTVADNSSYTGTSIVIPDYYNDGTNGAHPVTVVGDNSFENNTTATTLYLGRELQTIGDSAFQKMGGITSVTIRDKVTTIGEGAFYECHNLTNITFANGLITIGDNAFYNTRISGELLIPDSVQTIGAMTFFHTEITSLTIGTGLTYMGGAAFAGCEFGGTLTYNAKNCTDWMNYSFDGYYSGYAFGAYDPYNSGSEFSSYAPYFTTVVIGNEVEILPNGFLTGSGWDYYNNRVGELVFEEGSVLHTISENAFAYVSFGGTSISFPDSLETIDSHAFVYGPYDYNMNTNLESITLGENLRSIGLGAFVYQMSLKTINIPENVTIIGWNAFEECSLLEYVEFENTSGWYVVTDSTATSGTNITVTNPETNANNLKEVYRAYYWKHN